MDAAAASLCVTSTVFLWLNCHDYILLSSKLVFKSILYFLMI